MRLNNPTIPTTEIITRFLQVRKQTKELCDPLEIEDFVVQPVIDVSPLKWHLAHTTWFFETFVLVPYSKRYSLFDKRYPYLFNSYYISAGERWTRANRGQLTRPTVNDIFNYRAHVDKHMADLLSSFGTDPKVEREITSLVELGCHHEQQHQELFLYDVKRILGDNPLFPVYKPFTGTRSEVSKIEWLTVKEGLYKIGFEGNEFHFDNEKGCHSVFLHDYEISSNLVNNGDYINFIEDGGYHNHKLWLSEAWDWLKTNEIKAPRYWHQEDGGVWWNYNLGGYEKVNHEDPLVHVSYYEAEAFARWKGCRLPTEFEWEIACQEFGGNVVKESNFIESENFQAIGTGTKDFYGNVWEWTSSAYMPYPYFQIAKGALGEYNGKFMVNQMVLRGGSFATSNTHIRRTYRNFFHPHLRWLFAGLRLARHT